MGLNDYKKKIKEENLKTFYSRELKNKDDFLGMVDVSPEEKLAVKAKYEAMCLQVDACNSEEEVLKLIGSLKH